jgi:hypothetical protein
MPVSCSVRQPLELLDLALMLGTKELRQDRFCAHDRRLPPVVVAPLEHVTEIAAPEFTTFIAFY